MKILVVGSGGREHTLCWKLSQSEVVSKVFCAPGNGGTKEVAENIDIKSNDIKKLLDFALEEKIDLTVVGPEEPLVLGIEDEFKKHNLKVFGANKSAARLEGSKEFAKEFMIKHNIDTAKYNSTNNYEEAKNIIKDYSYPLVIKADGLCAGKGVIICQTEKEALESLDEILNEKIFGDEGSKVVIEEFLDGIEASLLCFVSNGKLIPMESAKDYKQIYDNDEGPNTGGVGCFSPSPLFTDKLNSQIDKILRNIEIGLQKDNLEYTGILFIGFMIVNNEPKILEFNVRFGDPETEVLLPRLESDLYNLMIKAIDGSLKEEDLIWSKKTCLTVVLTSKGYPFEYKTGYPIDIDKSIDKDIIVFHNGSKYEDNKYLTNGGRVLSITALADDLNSAREKVYKNIKKINFEGMYHRTDIGQN